MGGWDSVLRLLGYAAKIAYALLQTKSKVLATKVKVIDSTISEYRTVTRFTGIPDSVEGFVSQFSKQSKEDPVIYNAEMAQHISMLAYYPLEHLSYLRDKNILKGSSDDTWLYSSRAWAIWTLLEIFIQQRKYATATDKEKKYIRLYLLKCFSDFCLAYHWSVKKSMFSDLTIGVIGFIGTSISLYQKWNS